MKATEDYMSGETFRAIKNMSLSELNSYLYTIYSAGYADGLKTQLAEDLPKALDRLKAALEAWKKD